MNKKYKISGYDQIIEAEDPYLAAYSYFIPLFNIEFKKTYILNGEKFISKEYDEWVNSRFNYIVEDIETNEKYYTKLNGNFFKIEDSPIAYLKGDATEPIIKEGIRIITHICNDQGGWGSGFVLALSKKWKEPEAEYRKLKNYKLGDVHFVQVNENTIVANIIGQHCIGSDENGNPPIRYNAVREALKTVNKEAIKLNATIHSPYMGCGLAGGIWGIMEGVILDTITVPFYVYEF